jgi:hypothetical protein
MVGLVMEFPLGKRYTIVELVSATAVRVGGDATDAGNSNPNLTGILSDLFNIFWIVGPSDFLGTEAFTVLNTGTTYEMPEDFGDLDGPLTFKNDSVVGTEIDVTSELAIRRLAQTVQSTGRPRKAAVRPQIHDGRFAQRYDMLLWPEPDQKYDLEFRQVVVMPEIDATNPYPPGGALFGELYLSACLAEVDARINNNRNLRWQEFQERLAVMIEKDGATAHAETLGLGREDGGYFIAAHPKANSVTLNGVAV